MKFYDEEHCFDPIITGIYDTKIIIADLDTLAAAKLYDRPYLPPCCLNFASHKRPGGGYKSSKCQRPKPINTQEEDLFRRSNLPELMDNKNVSRYYPLMGLKGLYCNNIEVERDNYLVTHNPYYISLITVAAVVNPSPEDEELTREKIRRILNIAADQKEKILILGAWGCGVFKNDPKKISLIFKEYIDNEFNGVFDEIVFAIPGKETENYKTFESVLV